MKLCLLTLFISTNALASPLVIYGEDDRVEVFQSKKPLLKKLALSTAAMISHDYLIPRGSLVDIKAAAIKDIYKLCKTEKFRDQMAAANCSGTLIEKDIILTAGHCYAESNLDCKTYSWVFDYKLNSSSQINVSVPQSNIYKCKEIMVRKVDDSRQIDYALIRLDRKVTDRKPVDFRLTGDIVSTDKLAVIGYPRGVPAKIADKGDILENSADYLRSNLDVYTMNSGSGVFNETTGELEGILISGKLDFEDKGGGCQESRQFKNSEGAEIITKIKAILAEIDRF